MPTRSLSPPPLWPFGRTSVPKWKLSTPPGFKRPVIHKGPISSKHSPQGSHSNFQPKELKISSQTLPFEKNLAILASPASNLHNFSSRAPKSGTQIHPFWMGGGVFVDDDCLEHIILCMLLAVTKGHNWHICQLHFFVMVQRSVASP